MIPNVPWLGTTWVARSRPYWWRRCWICGYRLAQAAAVLILTGQSWSGLMSSGATAQVKSLVAAALLTVTVLAAIPPLRSLRRTTRAMRGTDLATLHDIAADRRAAAGRRWWAVGAVLALLVAALAGFTPAALALAVAVFALPGWAVATALAGFRRHLNVEEFLAVQRLRSAEPGLPMHAPAPDRSNSWLWMASAAPATFFGIAGYSLLRSGDDPHAGVFLILLTTLIGIPAATLFYLRDPDARNRHGRRHTVPPGVPVGFALMVVVAGTYIAIALPTELFSRTPGHGIPGWMFGPMFALSGLWLLWQLLLRR